MLYRKLALILTVMFIFVGCGDDVNVEPKSSEKPKVGDVKKQFADPVAGDIIATMKTTMGDIEIKLFKDIAPKAVENFVEHSKSGYYEDVIFHRVKKDFMIQGGDPKGTGTGGESIWKKNFEDEFSDDLHHFRGALAMANSGENTNGSQFFIVQRDYIESDDIEQIEFKYNKVVIDKYEDLGGTPYLDGGYTVFGQVIDGMDVVDEIAEVRVSSSTSKPKQDVKISKIEIVISK